MEVLQNDQVVKGLVASAAKGLGLPASLAAVINGGDPGKIDQNKVVAEMMNSPEMQKAAQQAPPVNVGQ